MKKKFWFIAIVVLVLALAAAAFAAQNSAGNGGPEIPEEVPYEENKGAEEKKAAAGDKEEQRAEGILTGRIDNHSVEIEVGGQLKTFALSEALQAKEFARGEISFQYYVDATGRSVITEADFQKPRETAVQTAEGTFQGLADNHTAEIEINGEARAFALDADISFMGFTEGDKIFIAFQENEQGRQEIIKIEKIL